MTQEFVTLPREVVEQALNAFETDGWQKKLQAVIALRAALDQPQNHVPDAGNMVPAGWKLVPIEPTDDMEAAAETDYEQFNGGYFPDWLSAYRAMLDAAPQHPVVEQPQVEQPQVEQPAMTPIAQRKLDSLLAEGYTISGYSIYHEQKHQHGFVTGAGLVGWWKPEGAEYPQPQGEQEPVAWMWEFKYDSGAAFSTKKPNIAISDGVEYIPLYTHPQPKRKPMMEDEIDKLCPQFDDPMRREMWIIGFKAAHNIR